MPIDELFTWWFVGEGAIRPKASWRVDRAKLVRRLDRVTSSDGGVGQAVGVYSPPHAPEGHGAVWGIGWR